MFGKQNINIRQTTTTAKKKKMKGAYAGEETREGIEEVLARVCSSCVQGLSQVYEWMHWLHGVSLAHASHFCFVSCLLVKEVWG
jgi:hypothetical protein